MLDILEATQINYNFFYLGSVELHPGEFDNDVKQNYLDLLS